MVHYGDFYTNVKGIIFFIATLTPALTQVITMCKKWGKCGKFHDVKVMLKFGHLTFSRLKISKKYNKIIKIKSI